MKPMHITSFLSSATAYSSAPFVGTVAAPIQRSRSHSLTKIGAPAALAADRHVHSGNRSQWLMQTSTSPDCLPRIAAGEFTSSNTSRTSLTFLGDGDRWNRGLFSTSTMLMHSATSTQHSRHQLLNTAHAHWPCALLGLMLLVLSAPQAFSQARLPRHLQELLDHCCLSLHLLPQATHLLSGPSTSPPGTLHLSVVRQLVVRFELDSRGTRHNVSSRA